jgi:hypothetical protein
MYFKFRLVISGVSDVEQAFPVFFAERLPQLADKGKVPRFDGGVPVLDVCQHREPLRRHRESEHDLLQRFESHEQVIQELLKLDFTTKPVYEHSGTGSVGVGFDWNTHNIASRG